MEQEQHPQAGQPINEHLLLGLINDGPIPLVALEQPPPGQPQPINLKDVARICFVKFNDDESKLLPKL